LRRSPQETRLDFSGINLNLTTGDIGPLRLFNRKSIVTFSLALSLVAAPLWAAHTDYTDWDVSQTTTIGTMQVQPGQYQVKAEEGKTDFQVISKGKVVATIPCQWIQLPSKAENTQFVVDGDKVTQVKFSGRMAAIQIGQ